MNPELTVNTTIKYSQRNNSASNYQKPQSHSRRRNKLLQNSPKLLKIRPHKNKNSGALTSGAIASNNTRYKTKSHAHFKMAVLEMQQWIVNNGPDPGRTNAGKTNFEYTRASSIASG